MSAAAFYLRHLSQFFFLLAACLGVVLFVVAWAMPDQQTAPKEETKPQRVTTADLRAVHREARREDRRKRSRWRRQVARLVPALPPISWGSCLAPEPDPPSRVFGV